jgi:O-antigen/teichoic acid export membrane protein
LLAVPVTYFLGIFPTLSRTYTYDIESFRGIVVRSLRLLSIFALPIGIGGTFLARPIVMLLFGQNYIESVVPLRILSWAAALIILRGTYRQSLNAAGRQDLDLFCALTSVVINIGLNLLLVPRYGIVGAAVTTLIAETVWLISAALLFSRHVAETSLLPYLRNPLMAAAVMGTYFLISQSLLWWVQAISAGVVYFSTLLILGETEVRSWVRAVISRAS